MTDSIIKIVLFVLTFSNVVDDMGDPHFDRISTHVDRLDDEFRNIAKNLLEACKNPQGMDKCERAYSIHKCWKMTDPKVIIIFTIFLMRQNYLLFYNDLFWIAALFPRLNGPFQPEYGFIYYTMGKTWWCDKWKGIMALFL